MPIDEKLFPPKINYSYTLRFQLALALSIKIQISTWFPALVLFTTPCSSLNNQISLVCIRTSKTSCLGFNFLSTIRNVRWMDDSSSEVLIQRKWGHVPVLGETFVTFEMKNYFDERWSSRTLFCFTVVLYNVHKLRICVSSLKKQTNKQTNTIDVMGMDKHQQSNRDS